MSEAMRWIDPFLLILALAPAAWGQPYAFITSGAGNSIAVLDLDDDVLVGSFPLDGLPAGSALTPNGARLYVALTQANALASINTTTGAVTMTPVGAAPTGVATDGLYVYVANTSDDTVSLYSIGTGTVLLTIPGGDSPLDLAVGDGNLYVANWGESTVSVFDTLSGGQLLGTIPVGTFPAGLALDPFTGRLYVANFFDDTVSVVDTATLSVTATIPVVERPRGLALDPGAARLYVAGFENADIQVIDTATNQVVLQGPSGGANPLDLALGPGGERLYVVHLQVGKSITVLDAVTLVPLTAIEAPPGPLAFAGFGGQAPPVSARKRRRSVEAGEGLLRRWFRAPHVVSRPRLSDAPNDLVILDTEFFENTWGILNAVGEQGTDQPLVGGNPDAWRRTVHGGSGGADHGYGYGSEVQVPGSSYDPATAGPVTTVDIAWDRRLDVGNSGAESFVVFQGGVAYRTAEEPFFDQAWTSTSRTGLTAADFDDGTGGMPDFSAKGGILHFGYHRSNPTGLSLAHGVDNFLVTVHSGGGGGPGILGFVRTFDVAGENPIPIFVERLGGVQGPVGVMLEREDLPYPIGSLTWADGDGAPKSVSVSFAGLEDELASTRLALTSPSGGASVDPNKDGLIVFVVPYNWPRWLSLWAAVIVDLQGLSPGWVLILAVPAALLATRRRHRQPASASETTE